MLKRRVMTEEQRLARQAYKKAYYEKNKTRLLAEQATQRAADPDKTKAIRKRHYEKNREQIQETDRNRYLTSDKRRQESITRCAAWYSANPERSVENTKKYRAKNASALTEKRRIKYLENRPAYLAKHAAYREANRDKANAYMARYYVEHKEKHATYMAEWRRKNPELRANATDRRTQRMEGSLTPGLVNLLMAEQDGKCCYCFEDLETTGVHMDHWMPLAKGGCHEDDNIVLTCPTCNRKKSAKLPLAFVAQMNASWLT